MDGNRNCRYSYPVICTWVTTEQPVAMMEIRWIQMHPYPQAERAKHSTSSHLLQFANGKRTIGEVVKKERIIGILYEKLDNLRIKNG